MSGQKGFSLLELLICVAIIAILMAMYLTTFGKAQRKAHQVVAAEGMRQGQIGRMADNANGSSQRVEPATREECRKAFREKVGDDLYATRLLYRVHNEEQFDAYFFTLIDADATEPLRFEGDRLVAKNHQGDIFYLYPMQPFDDAYFAAPVAWEFLSTYMGDMNGTRIGGDVLWGDGSVENMHYPDQFPMTPRVAELGRRFMVQSELD